MKRIINTGLASLFIGVIMFTACKPDAVFDAQPAPVVNIEFTVPQGWPAPFYNFANNKVTNSGFELGRKLFYDVRLSSNNTISCGSCHQQAGAFIQIAHRFSHGVDDINGTRNSPALFNMAWHTSFFWDGGVNHIESQPINPIQNPIEMHETMDNVIAKVKADAAYRAMFKAAFGDETVNSQRIFRAFAQFMGMMTSSNAKYDKFKRNEPGGSMTAQELSGYEVFKANCAQCHKEPLFTDYTLRNNGLPVIPDINDSGKARITHDINDFYKFKMPSLRNLAYTAPYMHDGRFETLEQVLDHYATGIKVSTTLDTLLNNGIKLNATQRADLLAFLNTLNDEEFIKNPIFAEVK